MNSDPSGLLEPTTKESLLPLNSPRKPSPKRRPLTREAEVDEVAVGDEVDEEVEGEVEEEEDEVEGEDAMVVTEIGVSETRRNPRVCLLPLVLHSSAFKYNLCSW